MSQETPPILDAVSLKSNTGGDVGLAIEILGLFKEQAQIWSRMLVASSPQATWADAAHSLKGASLGAGATALAAACSAAEKRGRSEALISPTEASVLLSAVKDEIGPALEAAAKLSFDLSSTGEFKV